MVYDIIPDIGNFVLGGRYLISKYGKIYSKHSRKELKGFSDGRRGYLKVKLYSIDKKPKTLYIHRLVLSTFTRKPYGFRMTVNHIDGDKINNEFCNLEWTSNLENIRHSIDNKLSESRSKQLSLSKVEEICRCLFLNFYTCRKTAEELNVSIHAVKKIKNLRNYKYISEKYLR